MIKSKSILIFGVFVILLLSSLSIMAQTERKCIRRGNRAFGKQDYVESEVQYRKALENNAHSYKGKFNLSTAQYKQNKYDDAISTMDDINTSGLSNQQKSIISYNKGNSLFESKKFSESVKAYKEALKENPNDNAARYNLSEAIRMMQQQQQQNNNNQQNKDNKDNKDNKNKNDQNKNNNNNKDKNKQNQDQNKDQDNNNKDKNNQQNQEQNQPKLSKDDAERILQALQNNEKDIQDKMKKEKAKQAKVRVVKNW